MGTAIWSKAAIETEIERLEATGLGLLGYDENALRILAEKTLKINRLKKEKNAVIPAHVYQRAEIIHGIADFTGDSYRLSKLCAETKASTIVFCGVRFMAETAKILSPEKTVLLPAIEAGGSLAESITANDVRKLKAQHPNIPVVTYINTNADVKAESDVIVTSANAKRILERLFKEHEKLIFLPDTLMGKNLAKELGKKIPEEMVIWHGTCVVHENFDESSVEPYRKMNPGVKILAHSECSPGLVSLVDFVGGTGDMLRYVESTNAPSYMLVTECGLGDLARTKYPDKKFIPMCRLCPYMKAIDLDHVEKTLENPQPDQIIEIPEAIRVKAKRALKEMFRLSE